MAGGILITGFEAFGGHGDNPSARIADALDGTVIAGTAVTGHVLPVVHEGLEAHIESLIADTAPRAVICLGLAAGEAAVRLERFAFNRADFDIPDNAGATLRGILVAGGPERLAATLPIVAMEARIAALGIPVRPSDSAGEYLCNAALYFALRATGRRRPPPACGFIHLPFLPEQAQGAPSLPLATMTDAVREAAAASLERGSG